MRINRLFRLIGSTEKSGLTNMIIKPIYIILNLIYTPILLNYLGSEKYGLWATILSVISWINYFDVGIGNGLRNQLTKCIHLDNKKKAKQLVSTSYIVLSTISLAILAALLILCVLVDWKGVFNTQIDIDSTLAISFVFICINFILSLSNSILFALQRSERVSIRNCIVQLINIFGLIFLQRTTEANLVYVALLFGGSSTLVYVYNSLNIFKNNGYLKPHIKGINKGLIHEISGIGIKFFIIQIMCLVMFTVDNLLITHYWGSDAVTPFSIVNKVFEAGYSVFSAFLVPYWSRMTIAYEQKDVKWVRTSIKKTCIIATVFILGYVIVGVAFKKIAFIWLHKELNYQEGLIPLMAIFFSLYSVLAIECQFINGTGKLKIQLIIYIIMGVMNIPLSIYLGKTIGLMAFGVRLATTILIFIGVIVLGINLYNIIRDMETENYQEEKESSAT